MRPAFITACFPLAWAGILLDRLAGLTWAGTLAGPAIFLFLAREWPNQSRALRRLFAALMACGLVATLAAPDPLAAMAEGGRRGAAYAAFFLALATLRGAAEASPAVRLCGAHLASQPGGRRAAAMLAGGQMFGMILSYGAIDLLGAMARDAPAALRRAMVMAAFRGFAVMNCWCPLNIMTAVVAASVPAAPMRLLVPIAMAATLIMLAIGWRMDRGLAPAATPSGATWRAHLPIFGLVALVMLLAEAVSIGFAVGLSTGVTAAVPPVAVAWLAVLGGLPARLAALWQRLPGFRGEAALLAGGGFLGATLGAALPAEGLAAVLAGLPPLTIPLAIPLVLVAVGPIGLNPIALVTVLGAAIPDPSALGIPPAALAIACMLGWGVGVGLSPMSASALAAARWTGTTPWQVTWGWNRRFTLLTLLVAEATVFAVHLLWASPK